jgi:hypothetical protein
VFDLEHDALVGFVDTRGRFRHHAVETRAFEARKPIGRELEIAGRGRQVKRSASRREQALEPLAPGHERLASQVDIAFTQQIEEHHRSRQFA